MQYKENEITVILTVWKRDHVAEQIHALASQTKKPARVLIYQNESHFDIPLDIREKYDVSLIQSHDINFKFHGRFTLPLLCDTEYVAIFDDDTIPAPRWLENCLRASKKYNCIVGANGRTLKDRETVATYGFGDGIPNEEDREVDFVGHCWFFKTEWVKYMWYDRPATWDNGEDIHLSAACNIYGNIPSYIPCQPKENMSLWGDTKSHYGRDVHATWKTTTHSDIRTKVVKYWREKGWKTLVTRSGT